MLGKAHSVRGGENEVRRVGPQFPFLKNGDRSEAPGQTGDIEVPQSQGPWIPDTKWKQAN